MLITQFCYSRNKPNFYLINYLLIMPKMNPAVGQISVEEHMHSSHSKLVQTNELEHDLFHALRAPTFMRVWIITWYGSIRGAGTTHRPRNIMHNSFGQQALLCDVPFGGAWALSKAKSSKSARQ